MKILFISDLHVCDIRNSREFESRRLEKLADFIRSGGFDLVFNLGDTVSRIELLRPEFPNEAAGFQVYLKWRAQFSIPFVECTIERELGFFRELLHQEPDSSREVPGATLVTVAPPLAKNHRFLPEEVDFLLKAVRDCRTPHLLIGSHVPYPGCCSRPEGPGIYLEVPERLHEALTQARVKVFWAGGHFHWPEEEPRVFGSLTAFHGGRFNSEGGRKHGYLRSFDTLTGEVATVLSDFDW